MERPILFSGPMVRALLDGRKTQTRRVVKGDKPGQPLDWLNVGFDPAYVAAADNGLCPYGVPGDLLWVREAFSYETLDVDRNGFMPPWYWADGNPQSGDYTKPKPSIHMPRWASRITLRITDVRVERLQAISEADALAEGVAAYPCEGPHRGPDATYWSADGTNSFGPIKRATPVAAYKALWEEINGEDGPGSWDANPWVWAVSFERVAA